LPKAIMEAGVDPKLLSIDDTLWAAIIRPLGFDAGIRSLSRTVQGLTRKIARQIVEGQPGPFKITEANLAGYLPS